MTTSPSEKACQRCGHPLPVRSRKDRLYCKACKKELSRQRTRESYVQRYKDALEQSIPRCKGCHRPIFNADDGQTRHTWASCQASYRAVTAILSENIEALSEFTRLLNYKPAQRITGWQCFFGGGRP